MRWLAKGAYLLKQNNSQILAIKAAGFGAPTAVITLEELIAYGIKNLSIWARRVDCRKS